MKRFLIFILIIYTVFAVCACGDGSSDVSSEQTSSQEESFIIGTTNDSSVVEESSEEESSEEIIESSVEESSEPEDLSFDITLSLYTIPLDFSIG